MFWTAGMQSDYGDWLRTFGGVACSLRGSKVTRDYLLIPRLVSSYRPAALCLYDRMAMGFLFVAVIASLWLSATGAESIMDHEPVEHLKAHLPKGEDDMTGKLKTFLQLPEKEASRKAAQMNKNLRAVLKSEAHVNVFLLHGSKVLAQRAATDVQLNSTILLPHSVLLPILSTTLPILLEGYKRELLHNPMGSVLKGEHRTNRDVKDYLSLSLNDLVTKLPESSGDAVDLESPILLSELNRRGKAALYFLNTALESMAEDAWKDALISVAMDHSAFSGSLQMLTHFQDLAMYADTLGNDLINFYEVSKSDLIPLDAGHFLYGWWFNCPRGATGSSKESMCLAPFLPAESMAVFNRAIRLYTIPCLGLHLLVGNSGETAGATHTLSAILKQDRLIWKALYSVIDPLSVSGDDEKTAETEREGGAPAQDTEKQTPTELPRETEKQESKPAQEEKTTKTPTPATVEAETHTSPTQTTPPQTAGKPSVEEDEVVGESAPQQRKKKSDSESKSRSSEHQASSAPPPSQKQVEEDVIVEEIVRDDDETTCVGEDGDKTLLVRAIYMSWPVMVFLFYVILSHLWVYWIMHLMWYICSTLFRGVYLPRPKTAKQD